jgi:hypothetical protein
MIEEVRKVATPAPPIGAVAVQAAAKSAPRTTPRASITGANLKLKGEDRQLLIAEAAYFRAERRGFQPGRELEDWLAAEIEIDALLGGDDDRA